MRMSRLWLVALSAENLYDRRRLREPISGIGQVGRGIRNEGPVDRSEAIFLVFLLDYYLLQGSAKNCYIVGHICYLPARSAGC